MEKTIQKTSSNSTVSLVLCGLFAALTAVCAAISIPLPFTPIPVSLTTLSVLLAGGLLGTKYGALSQVVYLLLGAIGVPVFANFTGGLGIVVGPTGGYIVGYILTAAIFGKLCNIIHNKGISKRFKGYFLVFLSALLGTVFCYALGTLWYMHVTNVSLGAAFGMCILPFIPGDLLKCIAATFLISATYSKTRMYI